jgi:acyl-coenzyme A synthetase/AMP-(fatty) acid ligase
MSEEEPAGRTRFTEAGRGAGWDEMTRAAAELRDRLRRARSAAAVVRVPTGLALVTALLAASGTDLSLVIAGPGTPDSVAADVGADTIAVPDEGSRGFTLRHLPGPAGRRADRGQPGLWLLSSGTTGAPKPTFWPMDRLARAKQWGLGGEHWAIGYAPHSFAAVSATCQALERAVTVEFVRPADMTLLACPDAIPLTVAAATPSFWRLVAIAGGRGHAFRQVQTVTVGGETVDQSLIDLLRETVAPHKIKQIFGTTELGTVIHVDDGLPGLPAAARGRRLPSGAAFDVRGERLLISVAPGEPYAETGDLVRLADGRVHVIGRVGIHVNVGGLKANPYRVAHVLQQHESVLAARAYGIRSPLLGQVIAADVVTRSDADPSGQIATLKRYADARLDAHERPRLVRIVEHLTIADSGKVRL